MSLRCKLDWHKWEEQGWSLPYRYSWGAKFQICPRCGQGRQVWLIGYKLFSGGFVQKILKIIANAHAETGSYRVELKDIVDDLLEGRCST